MKLALFDIDDTLLCGDSESLWCEYLTSRGLFDMTGIERFIELYRNGGFDFDEFIRFQLRPLAELDTQVLLGHRADFLQGTIFPLIPDGMRERVEEHRARGHVLLAISAAHDFLALPITEHFRMDGGLCTVSERVDGRYTGEISGTACFREGKITCLDEWLAQRSSDWGQVEESWFYSDSHNDLPLLERVDHPIAVRPDARLRLRAQAANWEILDFD